MQQNFYFLFIFIVHLFSLFPVRNYKVACLINNYKFLVLENTSSFFFFFFSSSYRCRYFFLSPFCDDFKLFRKLKGKTNHEFSLFLVVLNRNFFYRLSGIVKDDKKNKKKYFFGIKYSGNFN